jgi:hypothetical protein
MEAAALAPWNYYNERKKYGGFIHNSVDHSITLVLTDHQCEPQHLLPFHEQLRIIVSGAEIPLFTGLIQKIQRFD